MRTRQKAARDGGAQQAQHEVGVGASGLGRQVSGGPGAGLEALCDVEAGDELQDLIRGGGGGWNGGARWS
jgi:hypothetical protein